MKLAQDIILKPIITEASIDAIRENQMGTFVKDPTFSCAAGPGYGYGLGVRTLVDAANSRSPIGEFGWDGAAGAWTMVDPDNHIAAFYVQHVLGCGRSYEEFHPAIRNLIYEGLDI